MRTISTAGRAFTVEIGATSINFSLATSGAPIYHLAFNIPARRIDEALHWLQPRVELIPHHQSGEILIDWPAWNARSIYFRDVAGNVLEVIARYDLHNDSTSAFGPADFLCVSELGLVVPAPHAVMELLSSTLVMRKRSVLPGFAAIGDDFGMFILSAPGRPWMPTRDESAAPYPAVAILRHTEAIDLRLPGTDYRIIGLPSHPS